MFETQQKKSGTWVGIAAIVVTHNPRLAERMPRRLRLHEGLVVEA